MELLEKSTYSSLPYGETGRFGLRLDQMRFPYMVKNAGWYNHLGERFGYGDLAVRDFVNILAGLAPTEVFVCLDEYDSRSAFHVNHDRFNGQPVREMWESEPGIDYVACKARFVLAQPFGLLINNPKDRPQGNLRTSWSDDEGQSVTASVISPTQIKCMMLEVRQG